MGEPLVCLLERRRGGAVEASHHGAFIFLGADGAVIAAGGDAQAPVYPRSAIKLIQALPFLASGAARQWQADAREIALAAASHIATPAQIDALERFAQRLGISEADLRCGPDRPLGSARRRAGEPPPTAFHNNNAGKHLAVLATALAESEPISGYCEATHPAQQRLIGCISLICDIPQPERIVLDNCGMPTFTLPLIALARGMARMADPASLPQPLALAATTLTAAIAEAPEYFAGPRRLPSEIARITNGRIIAKGGSEGIFAGYDGARKRGFALKIADGSGEAASAVLVDVLATTGSLSASEAEALRAFTRFWQHPFSPERSPEVVFPFRDALASI